jgi:uncharacterized protein YkwD
VEVRRSFFAAIGAVVLLLCSGCGKNPGTSGTSPPSPTTSSGPTVATAADLVFCVNETNQYRQINGRPEVTRSAALEAFAAEGAKEDAASTAAHQHFVRTNGGGIAFAENELHRVSVSFFKSTQDAIAQSLSGFLSEGPGGGHYQNLMGNYTQVGCGVFLAGEQITFVQDFR